MTEPKPLLKKQLTLDALRDVAVEAMKIAATTPAKRSWWQLTTRVDWSYIEALRTALDAAGLDWKTVQEQYNTPPQRAPLGERPYVFATIRDGYIEWRTTGRSGSDPYSGSHPHDFLAAQFPNYTIESRDERAFNR